MTGIKKGAIWSAIERFSVQGTQFLLSLVISRLVTPEDFGLIAMIAIFMALSQTLVDSGFGNALIQSKDRKQIDYSTVFYFNSLVSVLLYLALFFSAPIIAEFYSQPELTKIIRYLSLNIIVMGLAVIPRTRMTINLDFKLQARISLTSVIIGGIIGILMAYKGYGVWALVFQTLIFNFLVTLLFWIYGKWKPSLVFSWSSFKRLFSFGSKLLISSIIQTIFLNLYSIVIGKYYSPSNAGLYNRAYTISQYPSTNITQILTRVIYPVQCARQDNKEWLMISFIQYLRLACYIVFPILIFIGTCSTELVTIVLSNKWIGCAPLITILCLAYIWLPIGTLNNFLILSQGASGKFLKAEIIKKMVAIGILIITLPLGVNVLCWGLVIYNLLDVVIIITFTKKFFNLGFIKQLEAVFPILSVTIISSLGVWLICQITENVVTRLLVSFIVFCLMYIGLSLKFLPKEISTVRDLIQKI